MRESNVRGEFRGVDDVLVHLGCDVDGFRNDFGEFVMLVATLRMVTVTESQVLRDAKAGEGCPFVFGPSWLDRGI